MTGSEHKASERNAAHARGKAAALGAVGVVGAAGWVGLETFGSLRQHNAPGNVPNPSVKAVAFTAGAVALGALIAGVYCYRHAEEIEETQKRADEQKYRKDWRLSIEGQRAHDAQLAREARHKR